MRLFIRTFIILFFVYALLVAKNIFLFRRYSSYKKMYSLSNSYANPKDESVSNKIWKNETETFIDDLNFKVVKYIEFYDDSTGVLIEMSYTKIWGITAHSFELSSLLPFDYTDPTIEVRKFNYDSTHITLEDHNQEVYIYYQKFEGQLFLDSKSHNKKIIKITNTDISDGFYGSVKLDEIKLYLLNPMAGYLYY